MTYDKLYHHGILGQKWGVRRFQNKDGTRTAAGKNRYKKYVDYDKREDMKKASENRRNLSDDEIRSRIDRIKLEKQLKDLTDSELTPGKKFVSDVMSQSGKKAVSTIVAGALLYGTKALLTKKFDVKEAAAYMTPKPKNK